MRVGVAGLGRMGAVLAQRLLDAGHEVAVWNRSPRPAAALAALGARVVASPAELAGACDAVVVLVTDDAAVRRVWLGGGVPGGGVPGGGVEVGAVPGGDGLLAADVTGKVLVESSTVRVDTVREVGAAAARLGALVVDAPVSGTVGPARAGQLMGLAGGDATPVAAARPVLDAWCRRVVHLGPLGAGMATKLALNMGMAALWAALGESYALAAAHGVGRADFTAVLADSPLAGPSVLGKTELLRADRVPTGELPAFDVAGVRKDLVAMVATAVGAGVPAAVAAAALAQFSGAVATGYGAADLVAVADYLDDARR